MLRTLRKYGGALIRQQTRQQLQDLISATRRCRDVQRQTLADLLDLNADSDFSRQHHLDGRLTVPQFRRRLPIADYDTFSEAIAQVRLGNTSALLGRRNRLLMFALSSGTTADCKYVPITDRFLADYRRGWQTWGICAIDDHARLHELDILQLASDYQQFHTPAGIPCGNISGLVGAMQSPVVRSMYAVPQAVTRIRQSEVKQYLTLRIAAMNRHVGLVMTANPSTLIQLARLADRECETLIRDIANGTLDERFALEEPARSLLASRLKVRDPQRARELHRAVEQTGTLLPAHIWPQLSLVAVWTGGSAGAYLPTLHRYFGDVPVRDHGLSASEGRMTIPLRDGSSSGVLDILSHYFEFIPADTESLADAEVLEAHQLQEGHEYFILLTTASGLYRYHIRDVVRCTGFLGTTPLLEFLHKGAHISNLTGEKISESQVVRAVKSACQQHQLELSHFTVAPVWGDPPGYCLLAERDDVPGGILSRLAETVDCQLQQHNCEYSDKRLSGRLQPLSIALLPSGTWRRFSQQRQSRPGASLEQYKHPCLVPDLQFSVRLREDHGRPPIAA